MELRYFLVLDDSGQLHPNYKRGDYFMYGGFVVSESQSHNVRAAYKKYIDQVKRDINFPKEAELKATLMKKNTRRRSLIKIKGFPITQVFTSVKVEDLTKIDFTCPRSVNRYKNFMVRRLIEHLFKQGIIPKDCTYLDVYIDNQNVAHNSIDKLEKHLYRYFNTDEYLTKPSFVQTLETECHFDVYYKDSANDYLVQIADLLACTQNTILNHHPKIESLLCPNYEHVVLP